jgi:arsenite methyltransferase
MFTRPITSNRRSVTPAAIAVRARITISLYAKGSTYLLYCLLDCVVRAEQTRQRAVATPPSLTRSSWMKDNRRPNYGLDAPVAERNLLIVAALGIISLITRLLHVWSGEDLIAVIARPLISTGLSCGVMGLWMIYDSKIGKVREREYYLDKIEWRGDERVLDVGCGLGLFLVGAAKRLKTGGAVGIDLWQAYDLSGNTPAGTLNNALIEGEAERVEVCTGDARKLPFDDASFDVVLSSNALHNIYNTADRHTAVREIARVLRVDGHVLILDVRHTNQYAASLRDAGVDARCVQGPVSRLLTGITFGLIRWGYVIGRKN